MRLRDKIFLACFIAIVLPMFLIWALWLNTATGSVKSILKQSLADRAREISNQISQILQREQKEILELTTQPAAKAYARSLEQNRMAQPESNLRLALSAFQFSRQHKLSAIVVVNLQGTPVFFFESKPDPQGVLRPFINEKNFSPEDVLHNPEILTATKPNTIFISDIQQDGSGPHVKIIAPLRNEANKPAGGLVVKVRADELLREAAGPRGALAEGQGVTPKRQEVIILSPEGKVLYASDSAKQWKNYSDVFKDYAQPFSILLKDKERDNDLDWSPYLIRHTSRGARPQLSIFMVENYNGALSNLQFSSLVLFLLTFLLVTVACLALYSLISRFTESISKVTQGARAIATGNLGYQISVKAKDETRSLAESFNRMAGRLREMIRKEGEQKQFESFARLSAVLTHDLKNQILSLSLLVSNMERKFNREGFKEDAMRTLSDSVNNLQNLVSKLSDPRTPTKRIRERSNLTHLVERVIQRTAGHATNRFKVSTQLTPDLYATVDGKAIERVIENLVINAIEAMPDGGALQIATRADNGNAIILVADTGKGMTEDFMRERLFHPFATTKKKGIGLGLYSCRDIIEQHGGRIEVASKVEIGTEFSVVLPRQAEEQKPSGSEAAAD